MKRFRKGGGKVIAKYKSIFLAVIYYKFQMEAQELERIRMLENRMRRQSKNSNPPPNNDQSLKSIKSTDSKKIVPINHKLVEEKPDDSQNNCESQLKPLSDEEIKFNRKITDYFAIKPQAKALPKIIEAAQSPIHDYQSKTLNANAQSQYTKSPSSPDCKQLTGGQIQLKQQNRLLKDKLKQKEEQLFMQKNQIVEMTIKMHKIKRNQIRMRVSTNKIRLGQYYSDKKGRDPWVDGIEIRQIKQRLQGLGKQRQSLQKLKKQGKKFNKEYAEDPEEWKNSITSQMHFLARQESNFQQILKRLEEEKAQHLKQYKLLYEEQRSKYGKIDSQNGQSTWPRIKKYQLLGLLGKGGFSQVYKAFDTQQLREVAVKVHQFNSSWNSNAKQNYVKHALRQNNVHKLLSHPNIVKLFDTVEIDANSFCTVLQFCEGPDLSCYLKKYKKLNQKQAKMIIKQVINAIRYLHDMPDKVIHYDLKPQNILFHKGKIKITDFGLCKTTKEQVIQLTSQGVGTYWYLPPQCFETDKKAVITPKVDIWSIGVIYFQMLYGEKPFGNQMSQMRILNEGIMLKANSVVFPVTQKGLISNESKQFIKQCLRHQVDDRMDIKTAANHRLFQKK